MLARYSLWGLAWTVLAGAFAVVLSLRYLPVMTSLAPEFVVYTVMGTLWVAFFIPAGRGPGQAARAARPRRGNMNRGRD